MKPQKLLTITFGFLIIGPILLVLLELGALGLWSKYFRPVPPPPETVRPDTFSFANYTWDSDSQQALKGALFQLFPIGTSQADVDAVLVTRAGASTREIHRRGKVTTLLYAHKLNSFFYFLFADCAPIVSIVLDYSDDDTLTDIHFNGAMSPCLP